MEVVWDEGGSRKQMTLKALYLADSYCRRHSCVTLPSLARSPVPALCRWNLLFHSPCRLTMRHAAMFATSQPVKKIDIVTLSGPLSILNAGVYFFFLTYLPLHLSSLTLHHHCRLAHSSPAHPSFIVDMEWSSKSMPKRSTVISAYAFRFQHGPPAFYQVSAVNASCRLPNF